ncbi:MAG: SAM-dependent methyltransferase [Myxococcota bacterium]|jgi:SAM-dependent methyltransferase
MSLRHAVVPGEPFPRPDGSPPYAAADLVPLVGRAFELPCDDPSLNTTGVPERAYLDGARAGWAEHPEWMDFLEESSPVWDLKSAERDLYMQHWRPFVAACDVLDAGCGVGRFTLPFLDRGASVWATDGDLESLRRCAWHAAGRPGRLELNWTGVHRLPEVQVDVVIAAEVLPYVPREEEALAAMVARLRPGGVLLFSLEARWGWAAAQDAPAGGLAAAMGGDGVVDLPGDRWVRTHDEAAARALVASAGLELELLEPSHWLTDGPLEALLDEMTLEELVAAEQALRDHPVWGPLHRLWIGVARRPE